MALKAFLGGHVFPLFQTLPGSQLMLSSAPTGSLGLQQLLNLFITWICEINPKGFGNVDLIILPNITLNTILLTLILNVKFVGCIKQMN